MIPLTNPLILCPSMPNVYHYLYYLSSQYFLIYEVIVLETLLSLGLVLHLFIFGGPVMGGGNSFIDGKLMELVDEQRVTADIPTKIWLLVWNHEI